jgi:hypothetical protein
MLAAQLPEAHPAHPTAQLPACPRGPPRAAHSRFSLALPLCATHPTRLCSPPGAAHFPPAHCRGSPPGPPGAGAPLPQTLADVPQSPPAVGPACHGGAQPTVPLPHGNNHQAPISLYLPWPRSPRSPLVRPWRPLVARGARCDPPGAQPWHPRCGSRSPTRQPARLGPHARGARPGARPVLRVARDWSSPGVARPTRTLPLPARPGVAHHALARPSARAVAPARHAQRHRPWRQRSARPARPVARLPVPCAASQSAGVARGARCGMRNPARPRSAARRGRLRPCSRDSAPCEGPARPDAAGLAPACPRLRRACPSSLSRTPRRCAPATTQPTCSSSPSFARAVSRRKNSSLHYCHRCTAGSTLL